MNSFEKSLARSQPDEVIIFKKRIDGNLKTIHNIKIFNMPFQNGDCWIVYNNKSVGHGSRTKILNKLRKLITK